MIFINFHSHYLLKYVSVKVTEARVTHDLLEISSEMTASLWRQTVMKEAGENCYLAFLWKQKSKWNFFRNVYSEKSKADDVQFILDLIAKIGAEIPQADMNNVNIAG